MEELISQLKNTLCKVNVRSLLVNGNVEKQLKFLLLQGDYDVDERWYALDKCLNIDPVVLGNNYPDGVRKKNRNGDYEFIRDHEIDLIAFNGFKIEFVAETKCSFVCDVGNSIKDGVKKSRITQFLSSNQQSETWNQIKNSAQYIVHFLLLDNPRRFIGSEGYNDQLKWLYDKYPHKPDYSSIDGQKFVEKILLNYKDYIDKAIPEAVDKIERKEILPGVLDVILVRVA